MVPFSSGRKEATNDLSSVYATEVRPATPHPWWSHSPVRRDPPPVAQASVGAFCVSHLLYGQGLGDGPFRTLLALLALGVAERPTIVTLDYLVRLRGISKKTAIEHIDRLEGRGLIHARRTLGYPTTYVVPGAGATLGRSPIPLQESAR